MAARKSWRKLFSELKAFNLNDIQSRSHPEFGFMNPCRIFVHVNEPNGAREPCTVRLAFEASAMDKDAFADLGGADWYEVAGIDGVEYHVRRFKNEGQLYVDTVAEYTPDSIPNFHGAVTAVKRWLLARSEDKYVKPFLPIDAIVLSASPMMKLFNSTQKKVTKETSP